MVGLFPHEVAEKGLLYCLCCGHLYHPKGGEWEKKVGSVQINGKLSGSGRFSCWVDERGHFSI